MVIKFQMIGEKDEKLGNEYVIEFSPQTINKTINSPFTSHMHVYLHTHKHRKCRLHAGADIRIERKECH